MSKKTIKHIGQAVFAGLLTWLVASTDEDFSDLKYIFGLPLVFIFTILALMSNQARVQDFLHKATEEELLSLDTKIKAELENRMKIIEIKEKISHQ